MLNIFGLPLLACCCAKENKLLTSRSLAIQKNTHILISIAHPIMRSHLLFLGAHRSCSRPKRHHRFHSRGSLFSNGASSSPQSGGERSGSTTKHKQRQPKEWGREGAKEIKRRNNKTNNNKYSLGNTENSFFLEREHPVGKVGRGVGLGKFSCLIINGASSRSTLPMSTVFPSRNIDRNLGKANSGGIVPS